MPAFLWPLASAFFVSTRNVVVRGVRMRVAPTSTVLASFGTAGLLSIVLLLVIPVPQLDPSFFWAIPVATVSLIVGRFALISSVSKATLSSTLPLIALAPLFIAITSWLILGEELKPIGAAGILLIVAGSYLLRVSAAGHGILQPFVVLAHEPAARLMVLAAAAFSVSAPFAKIAIESASTFFAFGVSQVLGAALIVLWLAGKRKLRLVVHQFRRTPGRLATIGLANFAQAITTYLGFEAMVVAYASGIKGTNILVTSLLGHLLFHEKHLGRTILVGIIMVAGVGLIAFG